jgi:hypothetical protein
MTIGEIVRSIYTQHQLGAVVQHEITAKLIANATPQTLWACGFGNWDNHLVLLPSWALRYVPHGEHLISIMGERVVVGVDHVDDLTNGGFLAYGFYLNKEMV